MDGKRLTVMMACHYQQHEKNNSKILSNNLHWLNGKTQKTKAALFIAIIVTVPGLTWKLISPRIISSRNDSPTVSGTKSAASCIVQQAWINVNLKPRR